MAELEEKNTHSESKTSQRMRQNPFFHTSGPFRRTFALHTEHFRTGLGLPIFIEHHQSKRLINPDKRRLDVCLHVRSTKHLCKQLSFWDGS